MRPSPTRLRPTCPPRKTDGCPFRARSGQTRRTATRPSRATGPGAWRAPHAACSALQGKGHAPFVPDALVNPTRALPIPPAIRGRERTLQRVGQGPAIRVFQLDEEVQVGEGVIRSVPHSELKVVPMVGMVDPEFHDCRIGSQPTLRIEVHRLGGDRDRAASGHAPQDHENRSERKEGMGRPHDAFEGPLRLRRFLRRRPEFPPPSPF